MLKMKNIPFRWLLAVVFLAGEMVLVLAGCGSSPTPTTAGAPADESARRTAGLFNPPDKGGAQLWAETCVRCHNIIPPQRFSDAQWPVIVQHMRLRADLTGEEQRKITAFLQASR